MRIILIVLSLSSVSLASPSQADWARLIFMGHNESSFFCLMVQRTYPGSYYDWVDSLFLCKYSLREPVLEEKHLLGTTRYFYVDTTAVWHWDTSRTIAKFPVQEYLLKHRVSFEFASTHLDRFSLGFAGRDLTIGTAKKRAVISEADRNLGYLKLLLDLSKWNNIQMLNDSTVFHASGKVVEYFESSDFYFFVIRTGFSYMETNYFRYVIPVPASRIRGAVKMLDKG